MSKAVKDLKFSFQPTLDLKEFVKITVFLFLLAFMASASLIHALPKGKPLVCLMFLRRGLSPFRIQFT